MPFFYGKTTYYAVAAASGLLLTLCFPPYGHGLVAWIALVPLLWLSHSCPPRLAFKNGWLAGITHGLSLLYWITYVINHYGSLPLAASLAVCFLLVAYLALYPAVFCGGLSWLRQRRLPWMLCAPCLWVAVELGKSRLLTGFPWENLGYSQYRQLQLIQLAEITGVWGLSFVVVAVNGLIFRFFLARKRKERWLSLLAACWLIATLYLYGSFRIHSLGALPASTIRVAVIQGNIPQELKWDDAFKQQTLARYVALSSAELVRRPDLLIWPETAAPFYFQDDSPWRRSLVQAVKKLRVPLLFGAPAYSMDSALRLHNRAYLLDARGEILGHYDKVHLVPFGEYVPWKRLLFFVGRLVPAAGDFAPGAKPGLLQLGEAKVGVLICYEAIFPELSRHLAALGANVLVNITNDAWFGRSSAPYQHLSMAAVRAVETRLPLIRCANTGISAFVDILGAIHQPTPLFRQAAITAAVKLGPGGSFYTRHGDWLAYAAVLVCGLIFVAGTRRQPPRDIGLERRVSL